MPGRVSNSAFDAKLISNFGWGGGSDELSCARIRQGANSANIKKIELFIPTANKLRTIAEDPVVVNLPAPRQAC
jgi:hypothetical protein